MLCVVIQVNHLVLCNPTRYVYNINKFYKIYNLKGGVSIIVHFVQVYLVDFNNYNVVTNNYVFGLHKFHQGIKIPTWAKYMAHPRQCQCDTSSINLPWKIPLNHN